MTTAPNGAAWLSDLRRPFAPAAMRFKLQAGGGTQADPKPGIVVAYIDARLVIERLNHVVGCDWTDKYRWEGNSLVCALTVHDTTRIDVGEPGSGPQGSSPKSLYSDALKRAGVKFGVGVSVYAIPKLFTERQDVRYSWKAPDHKAEGLQDAAIPKFRGVYALWLEAVGVAAFGEVIDHGDSDDSAGDHEVQGQVEGEGSERKSGEFATQKQIDRFYKIGSETPLVATHPLGVAEALRLTAGWVTRGDEHGPVTSLHNLSPEQYQRISLVLEKMLADAAIALQVLTAVREWKAERDGEAVSELPVEEPEREPVGHTIGPDS